MGREVEGLSGYEEGRKESRVDVAPSSCSHCEIVCSRFNTDSAFDLRQGYGGRRDGSMER